ncbi:MAG TPA: DUF58 domain-containing protein [Methylibium sp.]
MDSKPQLAPEAAEATLRRLEWTVLRRLDGALQGDYRTLFRGAGLDLADLREYQHYDEVRHIDWNVTARLGTPYVREYHEDRELSAWFLLDLSPSVDFGSQRVRKLSVAADFTALLARLLTRRGNRVGALLFDAKLLAVMPPLGGRRQVLHLLDRIAKHQSTDATGSVGSITKLQELLQAAQRLIKRRSLLFLVSDFISQPGWEASLSRLALRHDVVAVKLHDPMELALPDLGMVWLQDAETGEQLLVDTHDRRLRRRFEALAGKRQDELRAALGHAGVDALELSTDDDLLSATLRFAELRRQRSRLATGGGLPLHLAPQRKEGRS